MGQVVNI